MKRLALSRFLIIIFLPILIGPQSLFSQDHVDSLLQSLKTSIKDDRRVDVLMEIAWSIEKEEPQNALIYLDNAIELADSIGYSEALAKAYNEKGAIYWYYIGDYDKALEWSWEAQGIYKKLKNRPGMADTYNTLGKITEMKGDTKKALEYYKSALKIREELDDQNGIAWTCLNMGVIYSKSGDYDKALECKKKALKIYEDLEDLQGISGVYNNMGIIYYKKGLYNKALESYLYALQIRKEIDDNTALYSLYANIAEVFIKTDDLDRALVYLNKSLTANQNTAESSLQNARTYEQMGQIKELQNDLEGAKRFFKKAKPIFEEINHKMWIASNLNDLGRICSLLEDTDDAIMALNKSLSIQDEIDDPRGKMEASFDLGKLYLKKRDYVKAEKFLLTAKNIALKIGASGFVKDIYESLTALYSKTENYKEAFIHQELFEQIKDSLFNEEKVQAIVNIKAKYDVHEKGRMIEDLKQKEKIDKLTWYGASISLAGIIILTLLGMLFIRFQIQKKSHLKLAEQKQEIESKNRELAISNLELEQFAHVVSHDLKQPLRTIANYTDLIDKKYKSQLDSHGREYVGLVTDGVRNMHTLISDLLEYSQISRTVNGLELVDLNQIVNQVILGLDSQIVESAAKVYVPDLPQIYASRTGMTQIFQNLISNAIKFQKDGIIPQVKIGYHTDEENHIFNIQDNGIGISPRYFEKVFMAFHRLHTQEQYQGTGIGLAICQKIIINHNGKIWVESPEESGSNFFFTIPKS